MTASCLTSKGQITVPKAIRDSLSIGPGSRVRFAQEGKRVYLLPEPKTRKERRAEIEARLRSVVGILKAGMTTDELMDLTRGED